MHSVMAKGARSLLALALAAMTCLPSGIALIGMASSAMGETLPETTEVNASDADPALDSADKDDSDNKGPNGAGANDNNAVGSDATEPNGGVNVKDTDTETDDKDTDGDDSHAVEEDVTNVDEAEAPDEERAEGIAEDDGIQTMAEGELSKSGWLIDANGHCDIPEGETAIPSSEFSGITSLKSVTIPSSVTSIGSNAFHNCTSLTEVDIPNSVTSIGAFAFCDCTSLKQIAIPSSVTSIEGRVFESCTSLTRVSIPGSVTSIEQGAFRYCSSLAEVVIPNSVTSIGNYAFYGCSSLAEVVIPNSVTHIDVNTFLGCRSLKEITLPDTLTEIAGGAFQECTSLSKITIPNSVTKLGAYSFSDCVSLTEVTLPDTAMTYSHPVFNNCTALKYFDQVKGISESRLKEVNDGGLFRPKLKERPSVSVPIEYYTMGYARTGEKVQAASTDGTLLTTKESDILVGTTEGINNLVDLDVFPAPYGNDRKEIVASPYSWNQCYLYTVSKDGDALYSGHDPESFSFDDENSAYKISVTAKESPTVTRTMSYQTLGGTDIVPPVTETLDYYDFPLNPAPGSPWIDPVEGYKKDIPGYRLVEVLQPDDGIVYRYEEITPIAGSNSESDAASDTANGSSDSPEAPAEHTGMVEGLLQQTGDEKLASVALLSLVAVFASIMAYAVHKRRTARQER